MSGELAGKRILVVDDEIDLREIICEDLQHLGAEVFEAENGKVAYELYQKLKPDALVSDIRMPGGDGIELLKRIRAEENGHVTDVFFITGFADLTVEQAVGMGAQGMLSKPFNLHQLRSLIIDRLVRKKTNTGKA